MFCFIFSAFFPCCPCTRGVSLVFNVVCLPCCINSKLVWSLRFNTAVPASDWVPCVRPTLYLVLSQPGNRQASFCLPSSVPLVVLERQESRRTGQTSPTVLSCPSASLSGCPLCLKTGRCLWIWGYRADSLKMMLRKWSKGNVQEAMSLKESFWCHPGLDVLELFS